jgi:hypothetical protein
MWDAERTALLVTDDPLVVPPDAVVLVIPLLDVPDEVPFVELDVLTATCAQAAFDGPDVPAVL